jgi:hypothetical protein
MRKLYVDGRLLLTIEDVDNIVVENEENEKFTIKDYVAFVLDSNIRYDGIVMEHDFKWGDSNE